MRRFLAVLTAAALVIGVAVPLLAQAKAVSGEVIHIQCHLKRGEKGSGEAHASCAMTCAKKGEVMGILASDGVYAITGDFTANNNEKLLEYVAKKVSAKGEVTEKDGQKTIKVASIEAQK